jgi:guanylate kinase
VVSGPSGAGKTTIVARVVAEVPGLRFSISHTTRPPRATEADGREYHFVGDAAFASRVEEGRFLEWAHVHGRRYGTSRDEYEAAARAGVDLVQDVDVQGADQIRERLAEAVSVIIVPPSFGDLEARLRGRHPGDEALLAPRLSAALRELRQFGRYDYAIINTDLEHSVLELKSIILAARCRSRLRAPAVEAILETFPEGGLKKP